MGEDASQAARRLKCDTHFRERNRNASWSADRPSPASGFADVKCERSRNKYMVEERLRLFGISKTPATAALIEFFFIGFF